MPPGRGARTRMRGPGRCGGTGRTPLHAFRRLLLADFANFRQVRHQLVLAAAALRMAETAGAATHENDLVTAVGRNAGRHVVQLHDIAYAPRNIVVRAGGVAADADRADEHAVL